MDKNLLSLLDGFEECYPLNLEEQFPRVLKRIIELWNSKEIDEYFSELMIDNRGGTRQGFPPKVASEIFALSTTHANIQAQKQKTLGKSNLWDCVKESKRVPIEQQGYDFSPRGFAKSAEKGDLKTVQLFIDSGVDINTPNEHGWTPLMISTFNGREPVAKLLILNGADVNAKDTAGYGPLHWAAFNGYAEVVKMLIEKRANVNAASNHGLTPLLQAATKGHLVTAQHLLTAGADANLATNEGWTPLHKAAANRHTAVVKLLLDNGANPHLKYQDGTTPLSIAIKNKHSEIINLLKART